MAKTNNYSSWIFLGAAVVAGAGAFWLSHVYLKKQEEKLRTEVEGNSGAMVDVAVASSNLQAGTIVGSSTMSIGRLPKAFVTGRFVTAGQFSDFQGHALVRAKAAGEPLLKDDVGGLFVERFSDLLKPGERAITVEATELNANSGLLLPGDRVDFYAILKDPTGAADASTLVPLLENVHVLAAGPQYLRAQDQKYQALSERDSHYDAITVAVAVEDAEKLILARKAGEISYALRNSADPGTNVSTRLSTTAIGSGGSSAVAGSSDNSGSYEYFSVSEPVGVIRQANVGSADALSDSAEKQLLSHLPAAIQSAVQPEAGGGTPPPPASGTTANTTGSTQAPATTTNGTKRE